MRMDEMLQSPQVYDLLAKADVYLNKPMAVPSGCTANVALLHKNELYVANAGDSRCVVCKEGNAVALSVDHKPELHEEYERIKRAGGMVMDGRVNGNLNLSRAIGDLEYKQDKTLAPKEQMITAYPEVQKYTLSAQDEFMVLGCDGVWEIKNNQQVIDFCREKIKNNPETKPHLILEDLLDQILAPDTSMGFGCDNMTSILVIFDKK